MSKPRPGRPTAITHARITSMVTPLVLDRLLPALARRPFTLSFTLGAFHMTVNPPTARPVPTSGPLFPLGRLVATPNALQVLETLHIDPLTLLQRHVQGDWGDLDPVDQQANQAALQDGARLFSSYHLTADVRVWVITEADRSVTTLLMPEDY